MFIDEGGRRSEKKEVVLEKKQILVNLNTKTPSERNGFHLMQVNSSANVSVTTNVFLGDVCMLSSAHFAPRGKEVEKEGRERVKKES